MFINLSDINLNRSRQSLYIKHVQFTVINRLIRECLIALSFPGNFPKNNSCTLNPFLGVTGKLKSLLNKALSKPSSWTQLN